MTIYIYISTDRHPQCIERLPLDCKLHESCCQVRAPQPNWRGMCSVTAVGVEDLVDERLLQGENQLIDWKAATNVMGADMSEVEREAAKDGDCEAKPRREVSKMHRNAFCLLVQDFTEFNVLPASMGMTCS